VHWAAYRNWDLILARCRWRGTLATARFTAAGRRRACVADVRGSYANYINVNTLLGADLPGT
jgi:hypothetical protein